MDTLLSTLVGVCFLYVLIGWLSMYPLARLVLVMGKSQPTEKSSSFELVLAAMIGVAR